MKGKPAMPELLALLMINVPSSGTLSTAKIRRESWPSRTFRTPSIEISLKLGKNLKEIVWSDKRRLKIFTRSFWNSTRRWEPSFQNFHKNTPTHNQNSTKCWEMYWKRWKRRSQKARNREKRWKKASLSSSKESATKPWNLVNSDYYTYHHTSIISQNAWKRHTNWAGWWTNPTTTLSSTLICILSYLFSQSSRPPLFQVDSPLITSAFGSGLEPPSDTPTPPPLGWPGSWLSDDTRARIFTLN